MKKAINIIMLLIMLLGIAFSISIFISAELKAGSGMRGVWVDHGGHVECADEGKECDIGYEM